MVAAAAWPAGGDEQQVGLQSAWIKPRAPEPWQEMVAKRQAAYQKDPTAPQFRRDTERVLQALTETATVISANETDPMDGVLTEWQCSSDGNADILDVMWMAIIGETVRACATPYVYLVSDRFAK